MDILYSPKNRTERLIAAGRVALASSSLLAVWLDPSEPAKHAEVAYALLALYVVYAAAVALWVWRSASPAGRQRLVTHVFDFLFFSLFVYFTAGPASPFTTYFVFSMVCATLRWQWRGALWTAVAAVGTFLGLGIYFAETLADPTFELTPFIVRAVYMMVVAALLGSLGVYEQRTRREMAALAAWPEAVRGELGTALAALLSQVATLLEAPRLVLIWHQAEDSSVFLLASEGHRHELRREVSGAFEPWVAEELREASFLSADVGTKLPTALVRQGENFERFQGPSIHAGLIARLRIRSVLSLALSGEAFQGRIFVLDKPALTSDDLLLGGVVAEMLRTRIDLVYLTERLRSAAASEERVRLARDLHDGVLQSLTGVGLRLEALRRRVEGLGAEVEQSLVELQRLVAFEQRDLRFFIRELQPGAADEAAADFDLATRVVDLCRRLEVEWGLAVEAHTEGLDRRLPAALSREIYQMVREALMNAVRHGQASKVEMEIDTPEDGPIRLQVVDNGRGFPFRGRFSAPELAAANLGPRTLRERVVALDGSLMLESSEGGARLEIELPLPEAA